MTLSHELRTPMTAILGWSRLLMTMKPDDSLFRDAIAAIANGAQLQARLIDDILDLSRVVSGKLRLSPETIDVSRVIMNAVDAVSPTAHAKEITLTTSLAPNLGSLVADATRLQQVLWNLMSNALKFTPRNGTVEVSAQRTASQLHVAVTDSGEGIEPQFLPHVFEPFRQAETSNTRVHGGLGLGLSIVRYIVEAHGGTVTAQSDGRGKGATFTVSLPVRAIAVDPTAVRSALDDTFRHSDRLRDLNIAVVDDDPEARNIISAVLSGAGARVSVFESAGAALDAIDQNRPHIVITDIAMPDVDGYALTRALRLRPGTGLKVVALSAFPAAMEERGTFDAYLSKPIDPFHLVDQIARIAARAPA
jgi:CheY-like chemotaxis protein